MLTLGGRSDVIAQWFTKKYVIKHAGFFKEIVICPGEYAMVIRGGKIEIPITQDQVSILEGGLSERIKGWLGGGEDLQLLVVDVRPKSMVMPFSGFSKDHLRVGGTIDVTFRIDPTYAMRILNVITGPTILDYKWGRGEELKLGPDEKSSEKGVGIKELTTQDLTARFSKDIATPVTVDGLTKMDAKEIQENSANVSSKVGEILNSMRSYWLEYGIDVMFPRVIVSDNEYQEVMRRKVEAELEQRNRDIEFFRSAGDERRAVEIEQQRIRLETDTKLAWEISNMDYDKAISSKRAEIDVMVRQQNWDAIKIDTVRKSEIAEIENQTRQRILDAEVAHEADRRKVLKAIEFYSVQAEFELQDRKERLRMEREGQEDSQDAKHLERMLEIGRRRSEQRIREHQSLTAGPGTQAVRGSELEDKTCPHCSRTIFGYSVFCPSCGKAQER